MKNKTAFTLVELLVVIAICAIVVATVLGGVGACNVSQGSRVGNITKFSLKGVFNNSYEGELAMAGMRPRSDDRGNNYAAPNVWQFSVLDTAVAHKIQSLQDSGHRAKLIYHQTFGHNPFKRDTSYVIVEAIDLDSEKEAERK